MLRFHLTHRQLAFFIVFLALVMLTGFVVTTNYAAADGDVSVFLPIIFRSPPGTIPMP